jgi:hypothetical protein
MCVKDKWMEFADFDTVIVTVGTDDGNELGSVLDVEVPTNFVGFGEVLPEPLVVSWRDV